MVSCLICGPKVAVCGIVISFWGVIMLAMLGIFFSTHSVVLIEEVPFSEKDMHDVNNPQAIYNMYNMVGYNCFIAAGFYVVLAVFSFCQIKLNKRKEYMVH